MLRAATLPLLLLAACERDPDDAVDDTEVESDDTDDTDDTDDSEAPDTDTGTPRVEAPHVVRPTVCADPSARDAGAYVHEAVGPDPGTQGNGYVGSGASVGDLDGDGLLDLLLPGPGPLTWYRRTGEGWALQPAFPVGSTGDALGAWPVDVDADGDLDVHVLRFGASDALFENDGTGVFTIRLPTGIEGSGERSTAATWSDLDGDGDLDVIVGGYGADPVGSRLVGDADPTRVYLQGPAWTFTDIGAGLGAFREGWTYHVAVQDLDADDRPDLVALRDFGQYGQRNAVVWNRAEGLVPGDASSGLEIASTAMGGAFGDLDGDGAVDVAISGFEQAQLLLGRQGTWFDFAATKGFVPSREARRTVSWGVVLLDADHDGATDLAATFGPWFQQNGLLFTDDGQFNTLDQLDGLWLQDEAGNLTESSGTLGFGLEGPSRGLVVDDLDGDGWLDLVVRELDGPAHVYRARCGATPSVVVRPDPAVAPALALGARVVVRADGRAWTRWWSLGDQGCCGAAGALAHVGLGDTTGPVTVEVRWRDGAVSRVHGADLRGAVVHVGRPTP